MKPKPAVWLASVCGKYNIKAPALLISLWAPLRQETFQRFYLKITSSYSQNGTWISARMGLDCLSFGWAINETCDASRHEVLHWCVHIWLVVRGTLLTICTLIKGTRDLKEDVVGEIKGEKLGLTELVNLKTGFDLLANTKRHRRIQERCQTRLHVAGLMSNNFLELVSIAGWICGFALASCLTFFNVCLFTQALLHRHQFLFLFLI